MFVQILTDAQQNLVRYHRHHVHTDLHHNDKNNIQSQRKQTESHQTFHIFICNIMVDRLLNQKRIDQ